MKKIIVTLLLLLFYFTLSAQVGRVPYSFFVAGHSSGAPGVNNEGLHPPFKQKFDYIQGRPEIRFGFLTGDIVSRNPLARDWDEIDADIDTLGLPVYFAVGNHDMENRPLFESRYGSTYYTFIYQRDLFIVLDPNIDEWNISGAQLEFLRNTIIAQADRVRNIYVFFHQILWRDADNPFNYINWNSNSGRSDSINFWTEVVPLFRNLSNEVFMFGGDIGAMSWCSKVTYDRFYNITLISSGMGNAMGENFIVVNVESDKSVHYDVICLSDTNINCLGNLTDHLVVNMLKEKAPVEPPKPARPVYPNPMDSHIWISPPGPGATSIQLFNMQGVLILEETFADKYAQRIEVAQLPKGIYFAKISTDLHSYSIKLVKN